MKSKIEKKKLNKSKIDKNYNDISNEIMHDIDEEIKRFGTCMDKNVNLMTELKNFVNDIVNNKEYEEVISDHDISNLYRILNKLEVEYEQCKKVKKEIQDIEDEKFQYIQPFKYNDIIDILINLINELDKYKFKYDSHYFFDKYEQKNKRIYKISDNSKDEELIAIISFDKFEMVKDELNLFEPVFNIVYYNGLSEELISKEKITEQELFKEFENSKCFVNNNDIEKVFKDILIFGKIKGEIKVTHELFKQGFYLKDGKVLENSEIKGRKFTKEEIKEALSLLNEILDLLGEQADHTAAVLRFMLHAPFHWCIKELGKANHNIKYYQLYGKQGTNKTGAVKIGYWFYSTNPIDIDDTGDTIPAFSRKIQQNTFPSLFDDSYNLLTKSEMAQTLKSSTIGKYSRSVADKETEANKTYYALSTPIFTHNEDHIIKDGNIRRSMPLYYNEEYIISEDKIKEFTIKYNPENKDSKFIKFNSIGYAFKEKITPLIESDDSKLLDIEKVTTEILNQIAEEVNINLNPYLIIEPVRSTDLDEDLTTALISSLNKAFRTAIKPNNLIKQYTREDVIYIAENGIFEWLYYQTTKNEFIIHNSNFRKYCSRIVRQTISTKEILNRLDIFIPENTDFNSNIKVKGRQIRGFRIQYQELKKMFNINILDSDSLDDYN